MNVDTYINSWGAETSKTLWVEISVPSDIVRFTEIKVAYNGGSDKISATAVWASLTNVDHDRMTAAELRAAHPELVAASTHREVNESIGNLKGTGLLPLSTHVQNGILMQFTAYPQGIEQYQDYVGFDVTQRAAVETICRDDAGNIILEPAMHWKFGFPDMHPDAANDNGENPPTNPKSYILDNNRRMYLYDAPGIYRNWHDKDFVLAQSVTSVDSFETYIRINISNGSVVRPEGGFIDPDGTQHPVVSGSRASFKFPWSVDHTLIRDGLLKRTTGDAVETDANNVRDDR